MKTKMNKSLTKIRQFLISRKKVKQIIFFVVFGLGSASEAVNASEGAAKGKGALEGAKMAKDTIAQKAAKK